MAEGDDRSGRGWLGWMLLPTALILGVSLVCAVLAGVARRTEPESSAVEVPSLSASPSATVAAGDAKQKVERLLGQINTIVRGEDTGNLDSDTI